MNAKPSFSWNEFVKPYELLLNDIKLKFEKSNNIFSKQMGYAPIESIKVRVKSEESTRKKLEKKGVLFEEKKLKELTDLAGVRVVCKFLDDIPEIVGLVKSWEKFKLKNEINSFSYEHIEIIEEEDYVKNPKKSGYRSYHIVCKKNNIFFEIQVRTISMDFWASTEHMLKYKYKDELPSDIQEKLSSIADISSTLDMAMNDIRQDVKIGTVKARILEQLYKAIHILEENKMDYKADKYRERLNNLGDDLESLKTLAIEAKEDVPSQYWIE